MAPNRSIDLRPAHGHGALRVVALRDSRRPGLVAASGQTRWPPARRSRGAALTLTLNTAGPLTGARSRWLSSQPSATDSRPHHHHVPRHEQTLIATASSRTTAGSRCGTFNRAELTADVLVRDVSPAPLTGYIADTTGSTRTTPRRAAWGSGRLLERPVMVPRPTPSALAISATVTSWASYRGRATGLLRGELGGRPPRGRGPARRPADRRPLGDQFPLELGERGEDMEDQAAGAGGGVDPLCSEANATPRSASVLQSPPDAEATGPAGPAATPPACPRPGGAPGTTLAPAVRPVSPARFGEDLLTARRAQRVVCPPGSGARNPGVADTLAGERMHRKAHQPRSCTGTRPRDASFRALIPD